MYLFSFEQPNEGMLIADADMAIMQSKFFSIYILRLIQLIYILFNV